MEKAMGYIRCIDVDNNRRLCLYDCLNIDIIKTSC